MSLDTGLFQKTGIEEDKSAQARQAVKVFRTLQPGLTSLARVLTKNPKVEVVMATHNNGATDGKKIFYRPKIELGDLRPHERKLCDKRDDTQQLFCNACRLLESVMVTITHEISHICFESFAPTSQRDQTQAIAAAVREVGSKYAEAIARRIEDAPYSQKSSYIGLASLISPYLPPIVNGLEDARVNKELFKVRKGMKLAFNADAWKIFNEGVEQKNEKDEVVVIPWKEYPQNAQVSVGIFCKAAGYDYKDWFIEDVISALDDEVISELISKMDSVKSTREVYELSFPILERLRELGFCKSELDPEEEESEDDGEESEEEESESGEDGDSEQSGDSGDSGESSDSDEDQSDDGGTRDGESSDPEESESEENSSGRNSESDEDSESEQSEGESENDSNSDREGDDSNGSNSNGSSSGLSEEEPSEEESLTDGDTGTGETDSESSSPDDSDLDRQGDLEPVDTGADEGTGGTELIENEKNNTVPMGTAEDAMISLLKWEGHEKPSSVQESEQQADNEEVSRAIIQGMYFETPSNNVHGVRIHKWGQPLIEEGINMSRSWQLAETDRYSIRSQYGIDGDFVTPESILGPALLRTRVAFSDNQRGKNVKHIKSGRINGKVLGKRAPLDDERLFKRRIMPGKKDYFVLIGVDVSGSTVGINLLLEKKAVLAQAQLLHRMGIRFAIYAHSGNWHKLNEGRASGLDVDMYFVKEAHEPWTSEIQTRLLSLGPSSVNLDGHSLEFFRKRLDEETATDKIIIYFSDGKFPAEDYQEQLEILQREMKICKKKGYVLLGVGIRTDSPSRHGMDTVQVDSEEDVIKIVRHLEKRLLAK